MTQFLNDQNSIKNLRKELIDIQDTVLEVFSKTGKVQFPSWRFPDKLSCDLDSVTLLGEYEFLEGKCEANQDSHVFLLELVIDRLLLLLQSFGSYVEHAGCSAVREQTQQEGALSIGVMVKKYWRNLVQFEDPNPAKILRSEDKESEDKESSPHGFPVPVQQISVNKPVSQKESETKPKLEDSDETEMSSSCQSSSGSSTISSVNSSLQSHSSSSASQCAQTSSEADDSDASCQTVDSSPDPCSACHQVQSTLRKTGDSLVELFQREGLPSALQPLLAAVKGTLELGRMTSGDVARWAKEQLRDMRRLGRYLRNVRGSVDPLKERLAAAEAAQEEFRLQLESAQRLLREQKETIEQLEQRRQEEQQQMETEILSLEECNARLNEMMAAQEDTLLALEQENIATQERAKTGDETCCRLQHKLQQAESEMSETRVLLDKEISKYSSACRQQESVLTKQSFLLERVEALDKESEELRRQVDEGEERQLGLENRIQQTSKEKEQLQAQLTQQQDCSLEQQKENQKLEAYINELIESTTELKAHVDTLKENQRVLVAFPQLSPQPQAQPESTGNVVMDMDLQMQANSLRIQVLQHENANLHSTLEKLKKKAQIVSFAMETEPLQMCGQQAGLATQSVSDAWLAYRNRVKDARQAERCPESSRSRLKGRVSPTAATSSKVRVQTLSFNFPPATAVKSHTNIPRPHYVPQGKGWTQRRK